MSHLNKFRITAELLLTDSGDENSLYELRNYLTRAINKAVCISDREKIIFLSIEPLTEKKEGDSE